MLEKFQRTVREAARAVHEPHGPAESESEHAPEEPLEIEEADLKPMPEEFKYEMKHLDSFLRFKDAGDMPLGRTYLI